MTHFINSNSLFSSSGQMLSLASSKVYAKITASSFTSSQTSTGSVFLGASPTIEENKPEGAPYGFQTDTTDGALFEDSYRAPYTGKYFISYKCRMNDSAGLFAIHPNITTNGSTVTSMWVNEYFGCTDNDQRRFLIYDTIQDLTAGDGVVISNVYGTSFSHAELIVILLSVDV